MVTHPIEYDEIIPIVFLRDLGVMGKILAMTPHITLIEYELDGVLNQEWFDSDDYVLIENILLKHEEWE